MYIHTTKPSFFCDFFLWIHATKSITIKLFWALMVVKASCIQMKWNGYTKIFLIGFQIYMRGCSQIVVCSLLLCWILKWVNLLEEADALSFMLQNLFALPGFWCKDSRMKFWNSLVISVGRYFTSKPLPRPFQRHCSPKIWWSIVALNGTRSNSGCLLGLRCCPKNFSLEPC